MPYTHLAGTRIPDRDLVELEYFRAAEPVQSYRWCHGGSIAG
jgi:hypothetical protein